MASVPYTRVFLSGDIHWGARQSDPNAVQHIKNKYGQTIGITQMQRTSRRFLSHSHTTYLR